MSAVGNRVWRYTISTGGTDLVSAGGFDSNTGVALSFALVDGHTNLLQLDRLGNLGIGDDVSDGTANFSGRIWFISAASLASIPWEAGRRRDGGLREARSFLVGPCLRRRAGACAITESARYFCTIHIAVRYMDRTRIPAPRGGLPA